MVDELAERNVDRVVGDLEEVAELVLEGAQAARARHELEEHGAPAREALEEPIAPARVPEEP